MDTLCRADEAVSYTHLDVYKRQVVDGVAMSGDSVVTGNSATLDDGTELDRNTGLTIDDVGAKEEVNERNVEGNVDDDKDDGMYFGDDLIDEGNEDDNCS